MMNVRKESIRVLVSKTTTGYKMYCIDMGEVDSEGKTVVETANNLVFTYATICHESKAGRRGWPEKMFASEGEEQLWGMSAFLPPVSIHNKNTKEYLYEVQFRLIKAGS